MLDMIKREKGGFKGKYSFFKDFIEDGLDFMGEGFFGRTDLGLMRLFYYDIKRVLSFSEEFFFV